MVLYTLPAKNVTVLEREEETNRGSAVCVPGHQPKGDGGTEIFLKDSCSGIFKRWFSEKERVL